MSDLQKRIHVAYTRALQSIEHGDGIWISLFPLDEVLTRITELEQKKAALEKAAPASSPHGQPVAGASSPCTEDQAANRPSDQPPGHSAIRNPPSAIALPLFGRLFAVKDNIDVLGLPTTAACPEFEYQPERHAAVVQRLLDAGAICLGKTNLDQFATGLNGTRTPYGVPRNSVNGHYISGGSSSGSAIAVALGHVDFALGTDTAGSGRVPAAFNNLIGWKPTRGSWSTIGLVPACRTLDCITVLTHTLAEAVLVDSILSGYDESDPYSRDRHLLKPRAPRTEGKPRVAVLKKNQRAFYGDTEYAALYNKAIDHARHLGWDILEFDYAPFAAAATLLYNGPWVAERYAALEPFLHPDADAGHELAPGMLGTADPAAETAAQARQLANISSIHPVVLQIIESAIDFTATAAFRGQYQLAALQRQTSTVWDTADALLLPTAPTIYTIEEMESDPVRKNAHLGHYTNFVNLLDLAALAIPAGHRPDQLPFGITLIAPAWSEPQLAQLAAQFLGERLPSLPHETPVAGASSPCTEDSATKGRSEEKPVLPKSPEPSGSHPQSENLKLNTEHSGGPAAASHQTSRVMMPPDNQARLTPAGLSDACHLAVVGAHLEGQPLHHQLTHLGAKFLDRTTTAPHYRLYALANTHPPKPGLVRVGGEEKGAEIEVEVYSLTPASLGRFLKMVPQPLALGTLELKSGEKVTGFVCEPLGLKEAEDITKFGGWRKYLSSKMAAV